MKQTKKYSLEIFHQNNLQMKSNNFENHLYHFSNKNQQNKSKSKQNSGIVMQFKKITKKCYKTKGKTNYNWQCPLQKLTSEKLTNSNKFLNNLI